MQCSIEKVCLQPNQPKLHSKKKLEIKRRKQNKGYI